MNHEQFRIEIEGEEITALYPDLLELEVELDEELAGMFRMRFCMLQQADGVWTNVDDERLRAWKQVTIAGGFESGMEDLMTGYVTHVQPHFDPDPARNAIEIWGLDESVLMNREEKLKDWPNKKDSDIASEIFSLYGFTPDVEDTEVVHDEAVSTIIQRDTDIQFLKRLALRNGYECYVQGSVGRFRKPDIDADSQPVLAAHFGEETNLHRFTATLNALTPAGVAMAQVDRSSKEVLEADVDASLQTTLGETGAAGLIGANVDAGKVFVGMNGASGLPEMTALCQGLFHQGEWFVTAEGEVAANDYGHVLMPRGTVTIKGVGETHSGIYYVSHVTHAFSPDGYSQKFRAKRNAIFPSGDEDFAAAGAGLSLSLSL